MKKKQLRKLLLVVVILILAGLFFLFDLDRYLTLTYLKQSRENFQALFAAHPVTVIGSYAGIYIVVVALSLPGAAVMTLAGGALFGFVAGTVVVSFSSSIGAALACFVARYLFQDWVQARFEDRLSKINQGIEKEGAFYLFTLRLIPIIPFFVINLAMGLTRMPLWRFYWVSQLGMLPGTIVYVNAGKELGQIGTPGDILSPSLIISFVILGIFPLAVKKIMNFIRARTGKGVITDEPQEESSSK
ncbi:MAG: TVP38/TMEM64 family protein [Desulfohalobiaceae bacterium]|nr:TVP38/TMEM64 family protein [Desulfohalobiaceae bacterium]